MRNTTNLQHLTEDDVRRLLDPNRLLVAIESAFRERYPSITIPPRTHIPLANGIFLLMPCSDRSGHALGMKLVTVRSHPISDQDRVQATYFLLDPETPQPRLIVAANYLTDLRTAATSALATKLLAREEANTLAIFGTGRLARAHLAILPRVRKFRRVLVCGRTPQRSSQFIEQIQEGSTLPIAAADPRTCAGEADVICACTTSPAPLFDGHDLRRGTHLNLVGAFQPHTREADTHTIQHALVVVDTYDSALAEAGDILIPMQEGAISRDHIAADLHELLSGKKQGRRSPEEITVFKSVGCALEDLVAAELLLRAMG
jgi:ornithine cyclodeaminase/alanine dehydrogenase-like protein (mu-crystallin family)